MSDLVSRMYGDKKLENNDYDPYADYVPSTPATIVNPPKPLNEKPLVMIPDKASEARIKKLERNLRLVQNDLGRALVFIEQLKRDVTNLERELEYKVDSRD